MWGDINIHMLGKEVGLGWGGQGRQGGLNI